ncbi:MAG TPA: SMC-Scp complex subunit ScpB [Stellaceae bacterium]|nr:SMC-Scp complex subunit ScpB [Stellaceae bacterium]
MSASESEINTNADQLRLVEALLFAASAPLDAGSIAARLPEGTDVEALIAALAQHYESRGVNIVRVAGGWTLRTAPDLAPRLKLEQTVTRKLSRAAIETLAIIAYHQPVTRAEIEEIRGVVVSSGTLDVLMEAGWIGPKGRRETPGRPVTWATTEQFLVHFGLGDRNDLPGIEELKAAGLIGPRPDFTLSEAAALHPAAEAASEDEAEEEGDDTVDEESDIAAPEDEDERTAERRSEVEDDESDEEGAKEVSAPSLEKD